MCPFTANKGFFDYARRNQHSIHQQQRIVEAATQALGGLTYGSRN
jgi:hypothetical protein